MAVAAYMVRHELFAPASTDHVAAEASAPSVARAKPSITVLPFDNMSNDPSQAYFADGIAEDIITDLSQEPGLLVIARNSSFAYRGRRTKVQDIGRELGVRYVLRGSVRRSVDKVRINAQLLDAETGMNLWANRYDGNLKDVFLIQDDIGRQIVAALAARLLDVRPTNPAVGTRNINAYDLYLRAWSDLHEPTPWGTASAVSLLNKAIALDPNYARAHAAIAWAYLMAFRFTWHQSLGIESRYYALDLAARHVEQAMQNPNALAYRIRAELNYREGRYDEVAKDIARARALDPNNAAAIALLGRVRVKSGIADEAMGLFREAIRLDPNKHLYVAWMGVAEFARGNLAESARLIEQAVSRNLTDHYHLNVLIAAHALLGNLDRARSRLATMNALRSQIGLRPYTRFAASYSIHFDQECDLFRLREGLRLAGVPAGPETDPPITGKGCDLGVNDENQRLLVGGRTPPPMRQTSVKDH
jgi:TolB-like protein